MPPRVGFLGVYTFIYTDAPFEKTGGRGFQSFAESIFLTLVSYSVRSVVTAHNLGVLYYQEANTSRLSTLLVKSVETARRIFVE